MDTTIEFIKSLKSDQVELNNLKKVLKWKEVVNNKSDNIYFLSGVKEGLAKRAKDSDIISKKYFCIDVDLRNQAKISISNNEIKFEGMNMANHLHEEDKSFGKWRHIVFSGNGLHIYYEIEEKYYDPEVYAAGVEVVYQNWDRLWGDTQYSSDKACKNIARILRIPGSVNQKNGATVEILATQQGISDFDIELLGETALIFIQTEREAEILLRADEYERSVRIQRLIDGDDKSLESRRKIENLFRKINAIPAYLISEKLNPQFKFLKNNRNFLSDTKKGNQFTAFFYSSNLNGIVNGGSSFYNWGSSDSCYSPSVLVKNELNLEWKEVISWFKSNFKI